MDAFMTVCRVSGMWLELLLQCTATVSHRTRGGSSSDDNDACTEGSAAPAAEAPPVTVVDEADDEADDEPGAGADGDDVDAADPAGDADAKRSA